MFTLVLFVAAAALQAGEPVDQQPLAQGFVSSVDPFWHLVKINGGELVIDVSTADFRGPGPNDPSSFEAIRPGVQIAVVFQRGKYLQHQAIPATVVQVLRQAVGTITGSVESVDAKGNSLKVLGQTIHVTDTTIYGGSVASLDPQNLAELPVGKNVTVFLDGDIKSLTAQRIYVIAPNPDKIVVVTGTLKKVDRNTWFLLDSSIDSFKVLRSTGITGMPRVGDLITVVARVDGTEVTAESIELGPVRCPTFIPNPIFTLSGYIVALTTTSLTLDNGTAVIVAQLNDHTLYDGGDVAVGNNADVKVEKIGSTFVAKMVTKLDYPVGFTFLGTLTSVDGDAWTFESSTTNTPDGAPFVRTRIVKVTSNTKVGGNPQRGDRVIVLAERAPNGDLTAVTIDKDR